MEKNIRLTDAPEGYIDSLHVPFGLKDVLLSFSVWETQEGDALDMQRWIDMLEMGDELTFIRHLTTNDNNQRKVFARTGTASGDKSGAWLSGLLGLLPVSWTRR